MLQSPVLFDFNKDSPSKSWYVVDDGVMGGRSQGQFFINDSGHGIFKGHVSLKNNGGFSSLRHQMPSKDIKNYSKFILKLKGDGKSYQFRCKSNVYERHSYIAAFETTGDWQIIEINFADMYPGFRGQRLRIPNFNGEKLEEIAFLVGNKKEEDFILEIDQITLE